MRSWMYSTAEVDLAFAEVPDLDDISLSQLPDSKMVSPIVPSPSLNVFSKAVVMTTLLMPREA